MPPARFAFPLLRLLALLLAAMIVVQGLAAAQALALGTLHVHAAQEVHDHHDDGHHHHDGAEQHHHGADEAAIAVGAGEDSFETSSFSLAGLPTSAASRAQRDARRHVLRGAPPWAWRTASLPLPRKPPRLRA